MAQQQKGEVDGGGASSTTEPAAGSSTGTDVSLRDYFFALRQADERLRQSDLQFAAERDRRYAEVALEREKALKIKEEADKAALGLAREIQAYKDEKANELRAQIESERGIYPTKNELASAIDKLDSQIKPLMEYVTSQQGRAAGINATTASIITAVTVILTTIGLAILVAFH